jgi:hypothetical protein
MPANDEGPRVSREALSERVMMVSFEAVGLVLLAVMMVVIVAMLGPAAIGAVVGAGVAIGVSRISKMRQ